VLVFTQILERRVHKRFTLESNDPTLPPAVREAFAVMITDEKNHLEWVLHWLKSVEGSEALLQKYHAIDLAVYHHILPFEDHLWDLPNLGEEISAPTPLSL
jgi:hypothetical protein